MDETDLAYASDEVREMFCEQCDQHGTYSKAEGFCVDCSEHMCKMCLVYHKRYMPGHEQQDARNMPHDFCVEKCPTHFKLLIKYFCQSCDKFACRECKINDHKNCEDISHISKFVGHDKNKEAVEDIKDYVNYLTENLEEIQERLNLNTEHITTQETEARQTLYQHREKMKNNLQDMKQEMVDIYDEEINDAEEILRELRQKKEETIECFSVKEKILDENLNEAETNIEHKIEQTKLANLTKLSDIEMKHKDIAKRIEKVTLKIDHERKSGDRCSTFIAIKKSQQECESFEEDLKEMKNNSHVTEFKIEPKAKSFTFETVDSTKEFYSYKETVQKPKQLTKAVRHSQLKIKTVYYTSLCFLTESKLLVTDHKNCSISAFEDLLENKLLSVLQMPSSPWGIVKVDDNKVAVTFPELGLVRLLTLSEMMTVIKTEDVKVGYDCYGVACGRNRLIVSYLDPPKVKVLDMLGNVLRCFDEKSEPNLSFSSPKHLTLSLNKRFIYVSDCSNNTVTSLTFDGKVKAIYKDDQLIAPFQVTVDREGLVYVCGRSSNNVHQLTPDLKNKSILLNDEHKLVKPVSIALNEDINEIYIGMYSSETIQVFKSKQSINQCRLM